MADQLQLRRGTTSEILLFTGAQGEVIVDTDKNTLVVQDGITAGGFPLASEASVANGTFYFNDDTGGGSMADAYLLVPKVNTNTPTAYLDGIQLGFVTTNPNTGPATADFAGLGVRNIKFADGTDPAAGDIFGRVNIVYDQVNDWFELQPAVSDDETQIRDISATVALNAMTLTLNPCRIDFRSPIIGNGNVLSRNVDIPVTLVIPAGATLGTTNATLSKLAVVAVDTGSAVELAVVNTSESIVLDESTLINTLGITAASSSASTFYSTAPQAGVAYRVLGFVESTQALAGTWAAAPSRVQGQGGQALVKAFATPPLSVEYVIPAQAITFGGTITINHGLGKVPKDWRLKLRCTTAALGFTVGQVIACPDVGDGYSASTGTSVRVDATSLVINIATGGMWIVRADTKAIAALTAAQWEIIGEIWA